jgi:hypothetical protein
MMLLGLEGSMEEGKRKENGEREKEKEKEQ